MLFPELVTLSWLLLGNDEFDEEELCMMQANPAYRVVLAEFCF